MSDENQNAAGEPDAATMLAVELLAAYVSNNTVPSNELPGLIGSLRAAIAASGTATAAEPAAAPTPAVSIKKSVTHDFIICLEDGKKFKSLRRHLASVYDMTPEQYRAKWGLPRDYPMTAPSYSATRSALAKSSGLGQVRQATRPAAVEPAVEAQVEPATAKKAPRARKNGKVQAASGGDGAARAKKPRSRKATPEKAAA